MMERLILPTDLPDMDTLPHSEISYAEYLDWIGENVRQLKESGRYEALRNDPRCRPVDVPFTIKD